MSSSLQTVLDSLTREGELYERLPEGAVRCTACGHRCLIREGRRGICQVRFNRDGRLFVPWAYVAGVQCDPIEKKPFFHIYPGSDALTFGMLGCDFHCPYCQNWVTSQALRDPASEAAGAGVVRITPQEIVRHALRLGARVVASSYNEPLITSEWAVAVFREAVQAGLKCVFISNGNATPEALEFLRPWLTGYKVDLKSMNDRGYRRLGGVLSHTLETIRAAHAAGLWVEVVTLLVPGFNDSPQELWEAARFLVSVSPDIPWHVTAFHQDYHMTDAPNTTHADLLRAAEIGQEAGLRFVYAGNLPGRVGDLENTYCPNCRSLLIRRNGYMILEDHLAAQSACPSCGQRVPGIWG
ncbi:MAG: AmmeMemoRadiSam system radical SAM enzyme [Chloroflexi bacterium]|jgi:pyruvate formate lyase activating enzyme|nr:AmmeMemoRadiSam system radical SAM enzyme [Chloroflexota bacterium]